MILIVLHAYPGLKGDSYVQRARHRELFFPETRKKDCASSPHAVWSLCLLLCPWAAGQSSGQAFLPHSAAWFEAPQAPNSYETGLKAGTLRDAWDTSNWAHFWLGRLRRGFAPRRWLPRAQEPSWGRELPTEGLPAPCLCPLLRTVLGLASRWYCWHTPLQKSFARGIIREKMERGGSRCWEWMRPQAHMDKGIAHQRHFHPKAMQPDFYCPTIAQHFCVDCPKAGFSRMHRMLRVSLN